MNEQYLGNSPSLTNTDLVIYLHKSFHLPVWYLTMLTEPRIRNRGDRNGTNYRIGAKNEELVKYMRELYYQEESTPQDIFSKMADSIDDLKVIASRNNKRANHFRLGYLSHFANKERAAYFDCFSDLLDNEPHLVYIEPDNGVALSKQQIAPSKASAFIFHSEIAGILNKVQSNSILVIKQSLSNYSCAHEMRITDMYAAHNAAVLLIIDEIIQSGIFIITRDSELASCINSRLQYYLNDYRFLKNSSRILLGFHDGKEVSIKSIGSFAIENKDDL